MSKIRKQRRLRRARFVEFGGKLERTVGMGSRPGASRKGRREGSKPTPRFKGKNTLGRRKRLQEQTSPDGLRAGQGGTVAEFVFGTVKV